MTTEKRNGKFVVEQEVSPVGLFKKETGLEENRNTRMWEDGYGVIVKPKKDTSVWTRSELASVNDSPWFVTNVYETDTGPKILFERDE